MGAYFSLIPPAEQTSGLASPDLCDAETWTNTLSNRSPRCVDDILATPPCKLPPPPPSLENVLPPFPPSQPPSPIAAAAAAAVESPRTLRRQRRAVEFREDANEVRVYTIGSPCDMLFESSDEEDWPEIHEDVVGVNVELEPVSDVPAGQELSRRRDVAAEADRAIELWGQLEF